MLRRCSAFLYHLEMVCADTITATLLYVVGREPRDAPCCWVVRGPNDMQRVAAVVMGVRGCKGEWTGSVYKGSGRYMQEEDLISCMGGDISSSQIILM